MAFCELALNASDSSLHPGMNKRSRWFDHDRDLVVVLVAEPIERHQDLLRRWLPCCLATGPRNLG